MLKRKTNKTALESLTKIKQDIEQLLDCESLSQDARFLRRMAINFKQIEHNINCDKQSGSLKKEMSQLLSLFSKRGEISLSEAVDNFSYQEPRYSDLARLLRQLALID